MKKKNRVAGKRLPYKVEAQNKEGILPVATERGVANVAQLTV